MKTTQTECGRFVQMDDDSFERFKDEKLHYCHNAVRITTLKRSLGALILNLKGDLVPDHIDGNPLNCQRVNLRAATRLQNSHNQKIRSTNKSGYKGVSWHSLHNKWYASICVNYKKMFLGLFHSKHAAAAAYNKAAKEHFGNFARLNIIIQEEA